MVDEEKFQDEFPIEFHTEIDNKDVEYNLFAEAEERLHELTEGHSDITGASITISKPAQNRETNYIFRANVVLYARPNRIVAEEKHENPETALKNALSAAERQVYKKREELRNY